MDKIEVDKTTFDQLVVQVKEIHSYIQTGQMRRSEEYEQWVTTRELIQILRVSLSTVARWRRDRLIPYTKFKKDCLYLPSEIFKALKEKQILCDPKYIDEFHQNYINDVR